MTIEPIGSLLDSLGVRHGAEEGELVASALVLMRVISADGSESVRYAKSDGMSWVESVGMVEVARHCQLGTLSAPSEEWD